MTSCFLEKDGKNLLIYDPRFEFWRVPGGRAEFGESPEEALQREMEEELGVKIEVGDFLGFGQDIVTMKGRDIKASRLILYFKAKPESGKVKTRVPGEISDSKWLSLEKIKEHPNLEPGMKDLFKRFDI